MSSRHHSGLVPMREMAHLGSRRFWLVVDDIASENREARRAYMTDEQWARIFAAADRFGPVGLPPWVWWGLCKQKERLEESAALGEGPEDRRRHDLARERALREQQQRERESRKTEVDAASSRGRKRIA